MTEEIYKICLMCSRVYEGDMHKYTGTASHGVCPDKDCQAAYIMMSFGCDKEESLSRLERIIKKPT